MHVPLTPELETRVKSKVKIGLYNNASEVIREALKFMGAHEEWIHEIKLAHLKEQLHIGVEQLERGQGIAVASRNELDSLLEIILDNPRSPVGMIVKYI